MRGKKPTGTALEKDAGAAIGRRIRELMRSRGLAGKDVAGALGLSTSGVSDILHGRSVKQYVQLAEIARLLGVTPNDLLGFSEGAPADEGLTEIIGAAVEAMLIDSGWPEDRAERLVEIATKAAKEKQILDVDRRLAARTIAIARFRSES